MVASTVVAVIAPTVAAVPLKVTVAPAAKLDPVIVTAAPGAAPAGEMDVMPGFTLTVNVCVAVTLPFDVVTITAPVPVVPAATVAVRLVPLPETPVAATPLIVTVEPEQRFVPVMFTVCPTGPDVGDTPEMVGAPVQAGGGPRQELGSVMTVLVGLPEMLQFPEQVVPLTVTVCAFTE